MPNLPVKVYTAKTDKIRAELVENASGGGTKRRALLIGINYLGHNRGQLGGCINDAMNFKSLLIEKFDFSEGDDMRVLTDDNEDKEKKPTHANIKAGMKWLVTGDLQPGDMLFCSYSGHGSQVKCSDGSEADGKNEVLCPCDFQSSGMIVDDWIHSVLHDQLPEGVRLTCIFDCCHSGSVGDLPCQRGTKLTFLDGEDDDAMLREIEPEEEPDDPISRYLDTEGIEVPGGADEICREIRLVDMPKEVYMVSGCQDDQTSADAFIDGLRQGALSWAFLSTLREYDFRISYDRLLETMKKKLKKRGFCQTPSISTTTESLFRSNVMMPRSPTEAVFVPIPPPSPEINIDKGVLLADFTETMPFVVHVGLGWTWPDVVEKKVDLDAGAIFLNADKQMIAVVSWEDKEPRVLKRGVKYHGDNKTGEGSGDDETITINLRKLPEEVKYVGIVINSFNTASDGLGTVSDAYCRLYKDEEPERDLVRINMGSDPEKYKEKGLLMGVMHREQHRWYMQGAALPCEGRCARENIGDCRDFVTRKLSGRVPPAVNSLTVRVPVPEGSSPGDTIPVFTPAGYDVTITHPEGAEAGSVLQFEVPPGYTVPI
eukprot:CAMPEP_0181320318 /NCGR_PEP_ID=MMETSP1101-20121128/18057_1 /TAXON_ID=46948 /ORGANISM="Rhodomonas abbreviata, Strain Caron Lab Isolate" /LENGTH=598 /DNA_ID=CAMNT_0023428009 /DNA_START=67 /DNA_END=1863 /DNA_ORIENTATION=+